MIRKENPKPAKEIVKALLYARVSSKEQERRDFPSLLSSNFYATMPQPTESRYSKNTSTSKQRSRPAGSALARW